MDKEIQSDVQEDIVGQPEPLGDNQESPMPSEDEKSAENLEEGQLPEEVSERTRKEFEKLKNANKELSEKLKKTESEGVLNNVYENLFTPTPKAVPQQSVTHLSEAQVDNIAMRFVDDEGNVNIDALNRALTDANERAKRAEQEALKARESVAKDREQREVQEAHAKFPWLNPKDPSFDRQAFELVRDRLVRSMIEGTQKPLVEIAAQVMEVYKPIDVSQAKEQAVQEFKDTQTKKAQASSVSQGKGMPRESTDYSELRTRTMLGDESAIAERLRAITSK